MKTYKLVLMGLSALGLSGLLGGTLAVDSVRTGVVEAVKGTISDTKDFLGMNDTKQQTKSTPAVDVVEASVPDEKVKEEVKSVSKKKKPLHAKLSIVVPNTRGNYYIIKGSGDNAIIDGGYRDDASYLKNVLSRNGVYKAKYALSTTYKNSSVSGMLKNISYNSPDYILTYRTANTYNSSASLKSGLSRQGLVWSIIKKPVSYNVGYATMTLLPLNRKGELGVQVEYKNKIFFFAGDITSVDKAYLKSLPTKVDTYFISHSYKGYKTSQSLLKRLSPSTTVVNTQSELDSKVLLQSLKGKTGKILTLRGTKEVLVRTDGDRIVYEKVRR